MSMTDKVVLTIKSEDGKHEVEIFRGSHGSFQYHAFSWVTYDEEFKGNLGRDGDWHMRRLSGIYDTAERCAEDARLTLRRLSESSSQNRLK